MAGGGGPVKVKVVRVRGKRRILKVLGGLLSDFSYTSTYDIAVDEERGVCYKYEVLHASGRVSGEPRGAPWKPPRTRTVASSRAVAGQTPPRW